MSGLEVGSGYRVVGQAGIQHTAGFFSGWDGSTTRFASTKNRLDIGGFISGLQCGTTVEVITYLAGGGASQSIEDTEPDAAHGDGMTESTHVECLWCGTWIELLPGIHRCQCRDDSKRIIVSVDMTGLVRVACGTRSMYLYRWTPNDTKRPKPIIELDQ
jgi:hypothetical protein